MRWFIALALLAVGCSSDPEEVPSNNGTVADMGTQSADDGTAPSDMSSASDQDVVDVGVVDAATQDMGTPSDTGASLTESEPNDGATLDEIDDLPLGAEMSGVVDNGDSDVFFVDVPPGQLVRVTLDVPGGSPLQPHLTVFDAGRDGDAAGGDYVKIARDNAIEFVAMGEGGYYVAVRDARTVDGQGGGGADHTYVLRATSAAPQAPVLNFGTTLQGTLASPGAVALWAFEGSAGMNLLFDFQATGQIDGRLFVYASSEMDWVARQDDRTAGDPNPLLDAPLFVDGPMLLVVENIAEDATALGFTIDASSP